MWERDERDLESHSPVNGSGSGSGSNTINYKSDGIVRLNCHEMTAEISDKVFLDSGDGDVDDPLGNPSADRRVDDPFEGGNSR